MKRFVFIFKTFIEIILVVVIYITIGYPKEFKVFDATQYSNKPNLYTYGISPIQVYYVRSFYPGKDRRSWQTMPLKKVVHGLASKAIKKPGPVVLDIEHWPINGITESEINENIGRYNTILSWFKERSDGLCVGYFSKIPIEFPHTIDGYNYKNRNDGFHRRYVNWIKKNQLLYPLSNSVCASFPSSYTYDNNRMKWRRALIEQTALSRKMVNGPVYVFIWPKFYNSIPTPKNLRSKYIPAEFWRFQLDVAFLYADGVVIWGGWDGKKWAPELWNENAGWWKETKSFLIQKNLMK